VSRPRAADDFALIRTHLERIRREQNESATRPEAAPASHPADDERVWDWFSARFGDA
jgi:hypothetical protein